MAKEDYMARLDLRWHISGTVSTGSCPPIPIHRCELGKDQSGAMWLCEVRFYTRKGKYLVKFDTEGGHDTPFCRQDVVYASDYWKATMDVYNAKWCEYEAIQDEIKAFIISHEIQCKDVCGNPVGKEA